MATSPDAVRRGLGLVTGAAVADTREVARAAGNDPGRLRSALLTAVPLIVPDYSDAAAVLALDWYDETRSEARVRRTYRPRPMKTVTDSDIRAVVARSTEILHPGGRVTITTSFDAAVADMLSKLDGEIELLVADGFRETIAGNAREDPEAVGWKRHANPGACKFCQMLAAKGAVYKKATARFAAHPNCYCIAGPAISGQEEWAEATPMQYLASERERTPAEKRRLRRYLNQHYPDAPG